ncbi:MAG: XRE family transcriptional regulator [Proteobacteria bacterium]|nr:MAG: XRE family transcriptional regulator [Pseudomonadota bacterium]
MTGRICRGQKMLRKVVARNITRIRVDQGLSKVQLAKRTKPALNPSQITRVESGDSNLSLDFVERIAKALGVPPATLLSSQSGDDELKLLERKSIDSALDMLKASVQILEAIRK